MTTDVLTIISDAMADMNLNYEFMQYTSDIEYPYFTGEYQEAQPTSENGMQESTFILNGFSRTTWLSLEEAKSKIENYFDRVSGKTVIAESGNAVAVFYSNTLVVPTGDAELKRIQINLLVKEWKVN